MEAPRTIRYTSTPISGMIRTNRNQAALPQPDRSELRKISMTTVIRIQNQITQRNTSTMVQKMFRAG
jgi:multidrug efflux pump subunit AcrA (membrane-fusion protein)